MEKPRSRKPEVREVFHGVTFVRRHTVRSLASARKWVEYYENKGALARYEREKSGVYHVYTRGRAS